MNILLVTGEHWSVPGRPMTAHFDKESADAAAMGLVQIFWDECRETAARDEPWPAAIPAGETWQNALRLCQIARIEAADDEGVPDEYLDNTDWLAEESGADVWIDEIAIADPAGDVWAHPVPLKVMEAYRSHYDRSTDLLEACTEEFGLYPDGPDDQRVSSDPECRITVGVMRRLEAAWAVIAALDPRS